MGCGIARNVSREAPRLTTNERPPCPLARSHARKTTEAWKSRKNYLEDLPGTCCEGADPMCVVRCVLRSAVRCSQRNGPRCSTYTPLKCCVRSTTERPTRHIRIG